MTTQGHPKDIRDLVRDLKAKGEWGRQYNRDSGTGTDECWSPETIVALSDCDGYFEGTLAVDPLTAIRIAEYAERTQALLHEWMVKVSELARENSQLADRLRGGEMTTNVSTEARLISILEKSDEVLFLRKESLLDVLAPQTVIRAMRVVEQVPQAHAWHRESANTDVLALCPFALCRAYAAWDEGTLL